MVALALSFMVNDGVADNGLSWVTVMVIVPMPDGSCAGIMVRIGAVVSTRKLTA